MNKYFISGKLMHKASDHNTKRCEVEKWVFLPHSDFERLKAKPYQEHEAITAAKDLMLEDEKAYHCIMLLDEHGDDGLLIEAEGFDYPRLSMFVPDAALIYERYKTSEAELKLHDMIRDAVEKIAELAHTGKTDFTSADTEDKLRELQNDARMELTRAKISVDRLILRQKEGFLSALPSGTNMFGTQYERILPASAVANLYPLNYSGKTDEHGFYIGRDKYGSNVLVDFDRRTEDTI